MKNTSDSQTKQVVIAGAGCAGLAAGIALLKRGYEVTILESTNRIGGLAGGLEIKGNVYEYGPHIFHTTDPEILDDVKRIAGSVLIKFDKTIKIKFLGKYFDFPLAIRDVLFKLPPSTVLRAGLSFIYYYIKGLFEGKSKKINSEKVLQSLYGNTLYKIFFKDYIIKVWGIEPSEMAPSFAMQRIPRFNFLKFFSDLKNKFFGPSHQKISTENYVEKVEGDNYTTKKGFFLIAQAFEQEFERSGGKLFYQRAVSDVQIENGYCTKVISTDSSGQTHTHKCDQFISTIPINKLPHIVSPSNTFSKELLAAASNLKFRGIVFIGLLVKRENVLPASFMYFRDKSFNRITDLGQFKVEIKPEKSTILIAEITCQPEDQVWINEEETKQTVIEELLAEKLLTKDDILEAHVFKAVHGYPIYSVGYEKNLELVLQGIGKLPNVHTVGRQGKFAYINTHVAMKMGYDVARKIHGK